MGGVDVDRTLFFIGTGQNYEPPASPLEDTLLAINYITGELVWKYQYHTGDIWSALFPTRDSYHDRDLGSHPNLFSVVIDGKSRDYVGCAAKDGTYRIFRRDQPDPDNVLPLVQIQLDQGATLGAILATPVVYKEILYIESQAYVDPHGDRISLDLDPTPQDFLGGSAQIYALDLDYLIRNSIGSNIQAGPVPPPNESILWHEIDPPGLGIVFSPSGLSLINKVLFVTNAAGFVRALDATTGLELFRSVVYTSPTPTQAFVVGGVSIHKDRIFVPFGLLGAQPFGGVVSFVVP